MLIDRIKDITQSDIKNIVKIIKDTINFYEESNSPLEYDNELIDLKSVLDIIKEKRKEFRDIPAYYSSYLDTIFNNMMFCIHDYSFDGIISISYCYKDEKGRIILPWYTVKLKYYKGIWGQIDSDYKIPPSLCGYLEEMLSYFEKYKAYYEENCDLIKPINSDFLVSINRFGVVLYKKGLDEYFNILNIAGYSYEKDITIESCSDELNKICEEYKEILFKKTFIRIEDCPEWIKKQIQTSTKNQDVLGCKKQ